MRRHIALVATCIFFVGFSNIIYAESTPNTPVSEDQPTINAIDNWLTSLFRHHVPKGNIEIRYNESHQDYVDIPGYRIYKAEFAKLLKTYNDVGLVDVVEITPLKMPFLEWKDIKRYSVEPTKICIDLAEEINKNGDCIILLARPSVDSVVNTKKMLFRSNDPKEYKIITGTYKVNLLPIGERYISASGEKTPQRLRIRALVSRDKISKDCGVEAVDWGYIGEDLWKSANITIFINNLVK